MLAVHLAITTSLYVVHHLLWRALDPAWRHGAAPLVAAEEAEILCSVIYNPSRVIVRERLLSRAPVGFGITRERPRVGGGGSGADDAAPGAMVVGK